MGGGTCDGDGGATCWGCGACFEPEEPPKATGVPDMTEEIAKTLVIPADLLGAGYQVPTFSEFRHRASQYPPITDLQEIDPRKL